MPNLLDWSLAPSYRPYAVLSALCLLLFLPGIASIAPIDRDEARFMQATKQMLETGDLVNIRFQDEPRNKKPVGIYWLQTLSAKIAGTDHFESTWPYRIPSVLGAWLAVLALFRYGKRLFDPGVAFVAATMLATSFIVVTEAHIAKTDAVLLAAITVAMLTLASFYTARSDKVPPLSTALLFWAALGIGFLIKGPVIFLVVGATTVTLLIADRNAHWLKALHPESGIPVALAIVLPWILAVTTSGGNNFFADAVTQDLLPKLTGGQESHGALPGVHTLATLATAWPWSILIPFAGVIAWRQRANRAVRFCLAWLIPSWIIFELVPTKLPHYTMPLFPAMMLLVSASLMDTNRLKEMFARPLGRAYRGLWILASVGMSAAIVWAAFTYGSSQIGAIFAGAVVIATAAFAAIGFEQRSKDVLVLSLGGVGAVFGVILASAVLPRLDQLAISQQLEKASAPYRTKDSVMALAGFHEPSAVFLLGTETRLTSWDGAAGLLVSSEVDLIAIPARELSNAAPIFDEWNMQMNELARVRGRNYAKGEDIELVLLSAVPLSADRARAP